jgi:hypothetical protein
MPLDHIKKKLEPAIKRQAPGARHFYRKVMYRGADGKVRVEEQEITFLQWLADQEEEELNPEASDDDESKW